MLAKQKRDKIAEAKMAKNNVQNLIKTRTSTRQQTNNKQKPIAQSNSKMNNKKSHTATHIVTRQTRSNKTMNK